MVYKLFLDDLREIRRVYPRTDTNEWILVKNYNEFISCIKKNGLPFYLSLDHDLADEHYRESMYNKDGHYTSYYTDGTFKEKTGYDCAKWLCEYCMEHDLDFPEYQVHSMNPIGSENIRSYVENFKRSRK